MGVIVEDHFLTGTSTDLDAWTPDTTGNQWGANIGSETVRFITVSATTDDARPSAGTGNDSLVHASKPDPSVAEYDIEWKLNGVSNGDDTVGALARLSDISNHYWFKIDGSVGGAGAVLGIMSAGTPTVLDSDSEVFYAAADTYKFEIRDAAKKVYRNSSEILSSANNDITAAGQVCVGWGSYGDDTFDDIASENRVDDWIVTEIAGGAITRTITATASGLVREQGKTNTATLSGLIQLQAQTRTAVFNAQVRDTFTTTATTNAKIFEAGKTLTSVLNGLVKVFGFSITATLNAQVTTVATITATLNGLIRNTLSLAATLNAKIRDTQTRTVSLNGLVRAPGLSVVATANGLVRSENLTNTATLNAKIFGTRTATATLNAVVGEIAEAAGGPYIPTFRRRRR